MTHSCVFNSLFFIFFCFIDEHHFDFFLGFSDNDIQMRTELLPPPRAGKFLTQFPIQLQMFIILLCTQKLNYFTQTKNYQSLNYNLSLGCS